MATGRTLVRTEDKTPSCVWGGEGGGSRECVQDPVACGRNLWTWSSWLSVSPTDNGIIVLH